ncbi:hypothetical protein [Tenacibaculum maritimum]|uniref:hypothetical protein n=1 Tax=Tenacibaculum maritimum TaxID=107401 RepID=UPI00387600FD
MSNTKQNQHSYYQLATTLLFLAGALIYCQGIVSLSRQSVWFEFMITIVVLLIAIPIFQKSENFKDVKRLIILETGFNIICLVAKVSPLEEGKWSMALDIAFSVFFIFQIGGFIGSQIKSKNWRCLPSSIALGIGLLFWNAHGSGTSITVHNELQFWGGNTPKALQFVYFFWLLNLLFVEYRSLLPKLTLASVHLASFIIAFSSEEFFHARILTASHLVILNGIVIYKLQDWQGYDFSSISIFKKMKENTQYATFVATLFNILTIGALLLYIITDLKITK